MFNRRLTGTKNDSSCLQKLSNDFPCDNLDDFFEKKRNMKVKITVVLDKTLRLEEGARRKKREHMHRIPALSD